MQGISGIVTGVQCLKAGKVSAISSDAFAAALVRPTLLFQLHKLKFGWRSRLPSDMALRKCPMRYNHCSKHDDPCQIILLRFSSLITFWRQLQLRRANTGMPATRALITKLVRLIVETGCLTGTSITSHLYHVRLLTFLFYQLRFLLFSCHFLWHFRLWVTTRRLLSSWPKFTPILY